jgi:AcrR family transcriptional regulator
MARKPSTPHSGGDAPRSGGRPSDADSASGGKSTRERIIDAFMAALAEKSFEQIGLAEIAAAADVSLAELRNQFSSTLAILAAHMKETDRAVLASGDADMADEPARERLFDVLMRRIELLAPHRAAVRSLIRSASFNPGLAFALNGLAINSQQWMLTAAGISASGPRGMMRAQGMAFLFASVLRTWVGDDDPGLARTMAALDRSLARGQRLSGFLDDVLRIPGCVGRLRTRRPRRDDSGDETVAA